MVGVVLGLTGAGGGMLAVPALMFGLHWSVTQAAPVALLAVALSASLGALQGLRKGLARYRAALLMAAVAVPMSALGLSWAQTLPTTVLTLLFVAVMVLAAFRLLRQQGDSESPALLVCPVQPESGRFLWTPARVLAMSSFGALSGLVTGLLGVGGGFIIVPVLRFFTNLSAAAIVATSLMVVALVSAFSLLMASQQLSVERIAPALPFVIAVVVGLVLGNVLARRLPAAHVQQMFAVLMLIVAAALGIRELSMLG